MIRKRTWARTATILAALLVPFFSVHTAGASTPALPRLAPVLASPSGSAILPLTGISGLPTDLEAASATFNIQANTQQQQARQLTVREQKLTQQTSAYKAESAAYVTEETAFESKVTALGIKVTDYNTRVDTHNAAPHKFTLPQQQAQADAYDAEKAQLDAEGAALQREQAALTTEQENLGSEQIKLNAESAQLTTDTNNYNNQLQSWTSEEQNLETQRRQLLQQLATALLEIVNSPPTQDTQQSTQMTQGGDATSPALSPSDAQIPDAAPGGDPVSRSNQVAAMGYYAATSDVSVNFQPIVAQLSPSMITNSSASDTAQLPLFTSYDGLVPESNGHYRAIEIRENTGSAATAPGRAAFDNALAHGGEATATLDSHRVIIDGMASVPDSNDTSGWDCSLDQDKRTYYQPLAAGKSTGVVALICPQDIKATGAKRDDSSSVYVQGFPSAAANTGPGGKFIFNRTHIFGDKFGGQWIRENLFPGYARMNTSGMKRCENKMLTAANRGPVLYSGQVTNSPGDIPSGILMTALTKNGTMFNALVLNIQEWQVTC